MAFGMVKLLALCGLLFTFVGALLGTAGVFTTKSQALEYGSTYLSGENDEENLELPPVKNLLRQSRFAIAGFSMIAFGTMLQAAAVYLDPN